MQVGRRDRDIGPGGIKCGCCTPGGMRVGKPTKIFLNRRARHEIRLELQKVETHDEEDE